METWYQILFALLIGHALADYPLQGDFVAQFKSHKTKLGKETVWPFVLSSHCLVHAGSVWLITGSALLAWTEFVLHFIIDLYKCDGKFGFAIDQFLHVACKLFFVLLIIAFGIG